MGRSSNTYTVKYSSKMCSDLHKKNQRKLNYTCPTEKHRKEAHLKMEDLIICKLTFYIS